MKSSQPEKEPGRPGFCDIRSVSSFIFLDSFGLPQPHKLSEHLKSEYWFLTTEALENSNRHPSLPSSCQHAELSAPFRNGTLWSHASCFHGSKRTTNIWILSASMSWHRVLDCFYRTVIRRPLLWLNHLENWCRAFYFSWVEKSSVLWFHCAAVSLRVLLFIDIESYLNSHCVKSVDREPSFFSFYQRKSSNSVQEKTCDMHWDTQAPNHFTTSCSPHLQATHQVWKD